MAERTEIERRSREEPVLALDLKVAASGKNERLIIIATTFRNDGNLILYVQFDVSTLLIRKLEVGAEDMSAEGEIIKRRPMRLQEDGTFTEFRERILRPGQSREMPFFAGVPSPSLYLIQVMALYGGVEVKGRNLVRSSDVAINGVTQMITEIPIKQKPAGLVAVFPSDTAQARVENDKDRDPEP